MSVFIKTNLPWRSDYISAFEEVMRRHGFVIFDMRQLSGQGMATIVLILSDEDALVFRLKHNQDDIEHEVKLCHKKSHQKNWL